MVSKKLDPEGSRRVPGYPEKARAGEPNRVIVRNNRQSPVPGARLKFRG